MLAALALAVDTADDLVLTTVRGVHTAVAARGHGLLRPVTGRPGRVVERVHAGVTGGVYDGLGLAVRGVAAALRTLDRRGHGAAVEGTRRGRVVVSTVNGFVGDRLAEQRSDLAIDLGVRHGGEDVPLHPGSLRAAFPDAGGDLVVFVHGLAESDEHWERRAARSGGGYGTRLAADAGWTPVYLRVNTGLPVLTNGSRLATLLDRLVLDWPVDVRRIVLVGHSMGGLVVRAACAVAPPPQHRWPALVTDVVTLGTPHLGAPLERAVASGARALGVFPESAPFARLLDQRSPGILDLRRGLPPDVVNLPHARYRLVAATLATSRRHPVSLALGDLLVGYGSATGRTSRGPGLFPGAEVLHVRGDHFGLLDHPEVHEALARWLR
ncbi:MAG: alpha/beta hydrolase [Nocardioidaceae bacterium]